MGPEERAMLLEAFDSNWIAPLGPHVDGFERELAAFVNVPHAAALSSGTAGLHLALKLLDVDRDDEVLVSSFTFAATANAIKYCGAVPVFVDSELASWNLDPELLEQGLRERLALGRRPRAVIAVDLYGHLPDYDRVRAVCAQFDVPLIEDAAEALGSTYKGQPAGSLGDLGVFSFNGNKIITTSGGGMLTSARRDWIERARFWATQAREPAPHYEHREVGYNYRLSNLLAAIGRAQLHNLPGRIQARQRNRARYFQALSDVPGISFLRDQPYEKANAWLTCIRVDAAAFGATREDLRLALERADIESRPVWKPMHVQPVFENAPRIGGAVSEAIFHDGLCLPSGSAMTEDDTQRVVDVVLATRRAR
jgi:dTDP-4-amino-4,6-dideoxygalactose transaminase